jgi:transcriptional regulator with XRE-family HTH domain
LPLNGVGFSMLRRGDASVGDERAANPIDKKIGEHVRARRLEIGMSQEQLAADIKVTFQQIQKYEKGVNRIAASRLMAIADALRTDVCWFFEDIKPGKARANRDETMAALATPGAHELVRRYAALANPKNRRRVLDLVKAMDEES